ncbi:hypothetical protein CCUS01_10721 [Colletotrichum cuscutae]|uniref:Uncharacterized protein n=1 Tax=Colletotrichum cuscutae TaxID=1209917 RepID=A0AAI9U6J6_9PEZI|nr:hypothetical protein CCUS01_10721 [Colletotrichum cuscutae]
MLIEKDDGFAYLGIPEGGIVLYWIVTIFYICVTAPINEISNAITFSADFFVYGHFIIEAIMTSAVGFGFICLAGILPRRRTFDLLIGALTDGAIQSVSHSHRCPLPILST